jgi:hypothetical protein
MPRPMLPCKDNFERKLRLVCVKKSTGKRSAGSKKSRGDDQSELRTAFRLSKEYRTLPSNIKTFSQFVSGGVYAPGRRAKSPKAKKSKAKKSPRSKINMNKELRHAYALSREYGTLPSVVKNFSQFYSAKKNKSKKIKMRPAVAFKGKLTRFK